MELGKIVSREEFSAWVPFGDEGTLVEIRFISREELIKLRKEATKTVFARHQKTDEYDAVKAGRLLGKAAVKNWTGFTVDGDPYECTPENVEVMMERFADFAAFVDDTCTDMIKLQEAERETVRKNSQISSAPGVITQT